MNHPHRSRGTKAKYNDFADAPEPENKKLKLAAPSDQRSGAKEDDGPRYTKKASHLCQQTEPEERSNRDHQVAASDPKTTIVKANDNVTSTIVRSPKHKLLPSKDKDSSDDDDDDDVKIASEVVIISDDDDCSAGTSTQQSKGTSLKWLATNLSKVRMMTNSVRFNCPICFTDCEPGSGVILRECLHEFCLVCIRGYIEHSSDPSITCPYKDDTYSCSSTLLDVEVKELAPTYYENYLQRSLSFAESQEPRSFHCRTLDCPGWCIYEDAVNFYLCPVCKKENCITCKVIHEGRNCKQYQDDLRMSSGDNKESLATLSYLKALIKKKQAMKCPGCEVIIQKKTGCDAVTCSMCKMEICWATMMPRWGPKGKGDTSGGCGCSSVRRCHRKCRGCH